MLEAPQISFRRKFFKGCFLLEGKRKEKGMCLGGFDLEFAVGVSAGDTFGFGYG